MKYAAAVCVFAILQSTPVVPPNAAEETLLLRLRVLLLAAGTPVGVELRPFQGDGQSSGPLPPRVIRQPTITVDMARQMQTGPAALESFISANRGYELIAGRPVTAIRPTGAAADPTDWLNSAVSSYEVHDVTVVEALTQLRRQFDPAYDASRVRGAVDIAAQRFSVTLSRVTVRDVLDVIALAQGPAVWIVSFSGAAPSCANARIQIAAAQNRTHVTAYAGPPPAEPSAGTPGPTQVIPLPLTIATLRAAILGSTRPAQMPVGFELGPDCRGVESPDDRLSLDLSGLQPADLVPLVLAHCPVYEQRIVNGVLNIGAVGSFERSSVMNLRARAFGVASMPFRETLQAVRQVFDPMLRSQAVVPKTPQPRFETLPPDRAAAMVADMAKPIDLKLSNPTLRDALNGLVAAHGAAYWVVDPAPPPSRGPRITLGGYAGWQNSTTFSQGPGSR